MNRRLFVNSCLVTAACSGFRKGAVAADFILGRTITQGDFSDALPRPRAGQWVRFVLGSGVQYQKQIGAQAEATEHGQLLYYETQIGTPGGSCNPNTLKRTYLQGAKFASLLRQAPVLADVANSGTTLTRWSDIEGGQTQDRQDAHLRLLDAAFLYDDRPMRIVSTTTQTLHVPVDSVYSGSAGSARGRSQSQATTHVVADFAPPYDVKHKLRRVEFWTASNVPFGLVKYRAIVQDMEPFELSLFAYGTGFKTDLAMSLQTIRSITPDGTYVQTS